MKIIKIIGRLSRGIPLDDYSKILSLDASKQEVILFCDFSEFDIPINQEFTTIRDTQERIIFIGKVILKKVSQQFTKEFEMIPRGWQTICKFEIVCGDFINLVKIIPLLNNGNNTNDFLTLCS